MLFLGDLDEVVACCFRFLLLIFIFCCLPGGTTFPLTRPRPSAVLPVRPRMSAHPRRSARPRRSASVNASRSHVEEFIQSTFLRTI